MSLTSCNFTLLLLLLLLLSLPPLLHSQYSRTRWRPKPNSVTGHAEEGRTPVAWKEEGEREGEGAEQKGKQQRQAYVSLITTAKYLVGAEVLGKSLRALNSTRPLLMLVDRSLPPTVSERLRSAGWSIKLIEHVKNGNMERLRHRPWFNTTFSKLHVFGLEEYDKLVFLDCDILVLQNLDSLFDIELEDPQTPFAAASEVFPPDTFNSGVLVIKPSRKLFEDLREASSVIPSYDGSDQGFLNRFFKGWWKSPAAHRLPFRFNVPQTFAMYHPLAWRHMTQTGLAILHFAGDDSMKPWSFSGVVPPSLARFLFLWQEIARAPLAANVVDIYSQVLEDGQGDAQVSNLFGMTRVEKTIL